MRSAAPVTKRLPARLTLENYYFLATLAEADDPNWPSMNRVINRILDDERRRSKRSARRSEPRRDAMTSLPSDRRLHDDA